MLGGTALCWGSRASPRLLGAGTAGQWDGRIEALLSPTALGIPQGGGRIVGQKDSGTAGQWGSGMAGRQDQQGSGQRDGGTAEQHSNGTAGWQGSRTAGWQGSVIAEQWKSGRTARWQIRRTEGQWDSGRAGQQPSSAPQPQASLKHVAPLHSSSISAEDPLMLGDTAGASPRIHQSSCIPHSNACETITNTQCRKLICSQTSVLITGKVKKKALSGSMWAPASSRS